MTIHKEKDLFSSYKGKIMITELNAQPIAVCNK